MVYDVWQMLNSIRRAAIVILLLCLAAPGLEATTLEGRWKLVEQHAGSGRANMASPDAPLRLEFYLSGSALAGRIWTAEVPSRSFPWPSFGTGPGSPPIQVERVLISPASDRATAVYRVKVGDGEDSFLRVEEEYRLAEGGGILLGTVKITALERGATAGSYMLQRRFQREP